MATNAISPRKPAGAPYVPPTAAEKAILDSIALSSVDMPTRADLEAAVNEAKPRPKANLDATAPHEVYPLRDLIGEHDLRLLPLDEWVNAAKAKNDLPTHSRVVARRLQDTASKGKTDKTKALRYLYALSEFYNMCKPTRNGGKRAPPRKILQNKLDLPEKLISSIMNHFTDSGYVVTMIYTHTKAHIVN